MIRRKPISTLFPYTTLSRSDDVRVGAPVIAIGSPFGEEQSLSVGVVSATDRAIQSLTGFDTLGAVQTDAAINQGNSRSEEHTSELQSRQYLVCRLLLDKKKT